MFVVESHLVQGCSRKLTYLPMPRQEKDSGNKWWKQIFNQGCLPSTRTFLPNCIQTWMSVFLTWNTTFTFSSSDDQGALQGHGLHPAKKCLIKKKKYTFLSSIYDLLCQSLLQVGCKNQPS